MTGPGSLHPGGSAEEPVEEVLAAAAAAGHELSRDQLIRFHQHGLVGRPRQTSRGPGGGRGTLTLYPPGTTALVLELLPLRDGEHRLDELGWNAWWAGVAVPDRLAREHLQAQLRYLRSARDELLTEEGELTEKAEDLLDAAPDVQLEQQPMRWVRRRVGTGDFDLFLELLLRVLGGRTGELTMEHLELLEHGMGLDRARTDTLATTGNAWLDSDPRDDFEAIGQRVDLDHLTKALDAFSDDELRQARDKAKAFVSVISGLGSVMRDTGDRWSFGFAAFGAMFDHMIAAPERQAAFMLFMLSCMHTDGSPGIDQIIGQATQIARLTHDHNAINALREAVPAVAEALPLQLLGKAMTDPSYQDTINARMAELRRHHSAEIDAFFAAHPEHQPLPADAVPSDTSGEPAGETAPLG